MNDVPNDTRAQKLLYLMMQHFNQTEVNGLYFDLGVDIDSIPKPANKQMHIEALIRIMASRNSQKALTTRLKHLRPNLEWPNTYTISVDIGKPQTSKSIYFEQHVQEQHINIYTDTKNSRRSRAEKSGNILKEKKLQMIEEEIYQKLFRFTPYFTWFVLTTLFAFGAGFLLLLWVGKEFLNNYGLLLLVIILVIIGIAPRLISSYIVNLLRKSTKFYDLNVTDRKKVKHLLQQKRIWGNKVMNLLCNTLIKLLLETDLRRANRRNS